MDWNWFLKQIKNKNKTWLIPISFQVICSWVLQVPQMCAVMRLFSGPEYAELENVHLCEMLMSKISEGNIEEEPEYSQSVCAISSTL